MAYELHSTLPPAPHEAAEPDGTPRFGTYHGSFDRIDWSRRAGSGLKGFARRLARQKRWQYGIVATPELLVAFAVVDVGYASNAFLFASDLQAGRLLCDHSFLGIPRLFTHVGDRPGDGADVRFEAPGAAFRIRRHVSAPSYEISIRAGDARLEALLDAASAPPPLAVVMPIRDGDASATQKANLLQAAGSFRVGDRTFALAGGFGGLDYTNGLLARSTSWRWAFALGHAKDGTPVGLNLTDGLSDAPDTENVVWVGRELVSVGRPRFTWDANRPDGPWVVRTEDGALDLRFSSAGMHREERRLVVVDSRFVQVAGVYSGTLRVGARVLELQNVPGVTEDQRVTW